MNKLIVLIMLVFSFTVFATCHDAVVLVHGNGGNSSDWDNTYDELLSRGYTNSDIYRPNWGSACVACNNHNGSEEIPVANALLDAYENSCSGKIDVIGHSMGVTLAIKQIIDLGLSSEVDDFVGVAGALRGLRTCGYYPYNVWSSTCGYWGLSINSPFLNSINNQYIASEVYSIKSWYDQVVCAGGCTVNGVHSSSIWDEDGSFSYNLGHFGLQSNTSIKQVDLIQ